MPALANLFTFRYSRLLFAIRYSDFPDTPVQEFPLDCIYSGFYRLYSLRLGCLRLYQRVKSNKLYHSPLLKILSKPILFIAPNLWYLFFSLPVHACNSFQFFKLFLYNYFNY